MISIGLVVAVACVGLWLVALDGSASAQGISGYSQPTSGTETLPVGSTSTIDVACPTGDVVVGGGYTLSIPSLVTVLESAPESSGAISNNTWEVVAQTIDTDDESTINVTADCISSASVSAYSEPENTVSLGAGDQEDVSQACPSGDVVIGGGFNLPAGVESFGPEPAVNSAESSTTWTVGGADNTDSTSQSVSSIAICVASSLSGYAEELTQQQVAGNPTGAPTTASVTATCPAGALVLGGGYLVGSPSSTQVGAEQPASDDAWTDSVTNGGSGSEVADSFAICAAQLPTVTSLKPNSGPGAGGTKVGVLGSGFTGATAVDFGSTPATSFTVVNAGEISATAPAGSSAVNVTVTGPGGTSPASSGDVYDYAPSVTGVSPDQGPTAGGTSVVITGTGLAGATAVDFGSTAATAYTVNSATQITATSPAGSSGTDDITVTTPGGTSATSSNDQFTYVSAPAIRSVSPTTGPSAGDTSVTITGANFSGATAVKFGSTAATSFTVNSATSITATSPAGSGGTVNVTVTTAGGTSPTSSSDQFTYVAPPTVTSVSPNAGPLGGGTSVTITGTNLMGTSAVKFGSTAATSFTVNSATSITATSPAGSAGPVDVTVTTIGGTSATSAADNFTYTAGPTVTGVSPNAGSLGGGTSVTITGTNLTGASGVKFGSTAAASFTVKSATQITATSPAGSAGAVNVTVTTAGGTSATSSADQFTYVVGPTVTGVSPSSGPLGGGTSVTITGTNLTGATGVKFGSTSASSFAVNSPTQITATSPAGSAGAVNVTVTTAGGTSPTSSADQFTYVAPPTVTGVSPNAGPLGGGTSVTITGTNLTGARGVKFGSPAATSFTVNSPTQITATSPAGSAGTVNVTVTTAGGTSPTSSADQFTYTTGPTVSGVSPRSGPLGGGTSVTITGANLTGANGVKFGSTAATSFTFNSSTQIVATSPAESAGTVDVTVTTTGGTSPTSGADQFTYVAPPTVTAVSPSTGPVAGGTSVTITGTSLTGASAVSFGPTAAASFSVNSPTQITATSPAESAGTVDVTVTTPGGASATNTADQFTFIAAPPPPPPSLGAASSAPAVLASPPTVTGSSGAEFAGTVNPSGSATTAYFEYGLDPKYTGGGPIDYDQVTPSTSLGAGSAGVPINQSVSGLVPDALYHVRLVATNSAGTTTGDDETFTTAKLPSPPPPTLGETSNATPVAGLVLIKFPAGYHPHATGTVKGQGFIPLTQARQVPVGSQIDALRGTLMLVVAGRKRHTTQHVMLKGGVFSLTQNRSGPQKGLTTFALQENAFKGAPSYASCTSGAKLSRAARADGGPDAVAAKLKPKVLQTLLASEKSGSFRTRGRYSAATVRGTEWETEDRCDGTLTVVKRGVVGVLDFRTRKTITVTAGHSFLARAAVK